jgi:hypothetical protein
MVCMMLQSLLSAMYMALCALLNAFTFAYSKRSYLKIPKSKAHC